MVNNIWRISGPILINISENAHSHQLKNEVFYYKMRGFAASLQDLKIIIFLLDMSMLYQKFYCERVSESVSDTLIVKKLSF